MTILVIGAGIMGRGIAFVAAAIAELDVAIVDTSQPSLESAIAFIGRTAKRNDYDEAAVLARVKKFGSIEEALVAANVEFVIEAVSEVLGLKKTIFRTLCELTKPGTVLATNTSSLPVTQIAESVDAKFRDRIVGMHFFNPVHRMSGLEVISTQYTAQPVIDRTVELAKAMDRDVSVCRKDIAGFLVNRILNASMLEAVSLVERGAAEPEDIDRIMQAAAGSPMGPFRLLDLVGLDTSHAVAHIIYEDSGRDPKYKPSKLLDDLVSQGKLGVKTGEGFYKYKSKL